MISRPKAIAGALIGLAAAVTLGFVLSGPGAGTTYTIQSSYAFDVTNRNYIAAMPMT